MCANFTPIAPRDLRMYLGRDVPFEYRPEAYPGYDVPILLSGTGGELDAHRACFGLLPPWARDETLARRTYNARSETVAEKPSYRSAWRRRQLCLVPVADFFEPCYESGKPVRYRIRRADGKPFALAGLWETKPAGDALPPRRSFTLLTIAGAGHPIMQRMHAPGDEKRSVVVIGDADTWLDARDENRIRDQLRLFDAEDFIAEPAPRGAAG